MEEKIIKVERLKFSYEKKVIIGMGLSIIYLIVLYIFTK